MSKNDRNKDPRIVTIITTKEYKGAYILVQNIYSVFQYIVFYKGKFYSSYNSITSPKAFTNKELITAGNMCVDQAMATVETLQAKETGEDLTQTYEQGHAIDQEFDKIQASQEKAKSLQSKPKES